LTGFKLGGKEAIMVDGRELCGDHGGKGAAYSKEPLINLRIMAHCAFDRGRGGGGAVVSAGSSDRAALSEEGPSRRSSSVSDRCDIPKSPPAAWMSPR
jgi:hypothetical protein